jgi:hypothetical protein
LQAVAKRGGSSLANRIAPAMGDGQDAVKYTAAAAGVRLGDVRRKEQPARTGAELLHFANSSKFRVRLRVLGSTLTSHARVGPLQARAGEDARPTSASLFVSDHYFGRGPIVRAVIYTDYHNVIEAGIVSWLGLRVLRDRNHKVIVLFL